MEAARMGGDKDGTEPTVRVLEDEDAPAAVSLINAAAEWYAEILPASEVRRPEMTVDEWHEEARRMTWYGAYDAGVLVGVMALEYSGDVVLFRHGYVHPERQRLGVAGLLHDHLEAQVRGVERIVIGTYSANYKARRALEKAGYRPSANPAAVLRRYYDIPEDRLRSSMTYEKRVG